MFVLRVTIRNSVPSNSARIRTTNMLQNNSDLSCAIEDKGNFKADGNHIHVRDLFTPKVEAVLVQWHSRHVWIAWSSSLRFLLHSTVSKDYGKTAQKPAKGCSENHQRTLVALMLTPSTVFSCISYPNNSPKIVFSCLRLSRTLPGSLVKRC